MVKMSQSRRAMVEVALMTSILFLSPCLMAKEVTFESLLREMVDREALARWPDPAYICKQFSSYERASVAPDKPGWFANHDWSHFLRAEDNDGRREWVMMDASGPGCVVRIWLGAPHPDKGPMGTIRIYLDDKETPVIEETADILLSGKGPVGPPLSAVRSIGRNLYLPIPYARRFKITYDRPRFWDSRKNEDRCWYVINYRAYAPDTTVKSFSMEALEAARGLLNRIQRILLTPQNWVGGGVTLHRPETVELGPDEKIRRSFKGPGAIRQLSVQLDPAVSDQALHSTVLAIEFDGVQAVWCPVGDFFGSGVGLNPYRGWWRTIDRNGLMTCYWVMPFREQCSIALVNHGQQRIEATLGSIGTSGWTWDDRSMYFHANWRQQYPFSSKKTDGFDWNYIDIKGVGVYVGDTLSLRNGAAAWWGEGDEKIFVDGEAFPSHFGTGTEDYYGYSFGDRGVFFEAPFHAQPRAEGNNRPGHTTNTRTRSLDAIPFSTSLKVDMEVWHWARATMAYAVSTYWYARPGAIHNRPPALEEARRPVPGPRRVEGAIEGETIKVIKKTGGFTEIQHGSELQWSNEAQLWWRDASPGDRLVLALEVATPGRHEIRGHFTRARDYGIIQCSIDGRALGKEIDFYSPEVRSSGELLLGSIELTAGTHQFEARIVGANAAAEKRYMFGLDYLRLNR